MDRIIAIVLLFVIIIFSSCQKESITHRGNVHLIQDVVYGKNNDWNGKMVNLTLDLYKPEQKIHVNSSSYPLILFLHGGGFLTGDKSQGADYARALTKKGYVVASINYRLGWNQNPENLCNSDPVETNKALYRAMQDTKAALSFLTSKANEYNIDPSWVFVSGSSAGAITVLDAVYYDQVSADQYFGNISKELGLLNPGNQLVNSYSLKGIISMWGSVNEIEIINHQNAVPTLFFHGEKDPEVPIGIGNFYGCKNLPKSYGTLPIYDRLTALGVSAVAHIDPNGNHRVYNNEFITANTDCFIQSIMADKKINGYYYNEEGSCINSPK